jgi:hypothetical protein
VLSSQLKTSFRELLKNRSRKIEAERLRHVAQFLGSRVGDWFSAWLNILKAVAEWPEFQSNDAAGHESSIRKAASVLWEFSGGVYTLDAGGTVLSSFPRDIRGQNYAHREYFRLCSQQRTGVVSNSFDSANRDHAIVVVAVPRFDGNGAYLGILDVVIDIDDSPLSRVTQPIVLDPSEGPAAHIILVDQRRVVVGANTLDVVGKNIGGHPLIRRLFEAKPSREGGFVLEQEHAAAAVPVANTPFILVVVGGRLEW